MQGQQLFLSTSSAHTSTAGEKVSDESTDKQHHRITHSPLDSSTPLQSSTSITTKEKSYAKDKIEMNNTNEKTEMSLLMSFKPRSVEHIEIYKLLRRLNYDTAFPIISVLFRNTFRNLQRYLNEWIDMLEDIFSQKLSVQKLKDWNMNAFRELQSGNDFFAFGIRHLDIRNCNRNLQELYDIVQNYQVHIAYVSKISSYDLLLSPEIGILELGSEIRIRILESHLFHEWYNYGHHILDQFQQSISNKLVELEKMLLPQFRAQLDKRRTELDKLRIESDSELINELRTELDKRVTKLDKRRIELDSKLGSLKPYLPEMVTAKNVIRPRTKSNVRKQTQVFEQSSFIPEDKFIIISKYLFGQDIPPKKYTRFIHAYYLCGLRRQPQMRHWTDSEMNILTCIKQQCRFLSCPWRKISPLS